MSVSLEDPSLRGRWAIVAAAASLASHLGPVDAWQELVGVGANALLASFTALLPALPVVLALAFMSMSMPVARVAVPHLVLLGVVLSWPRRLRRMGGG